MKISHRLTAMSALSATALCLVAGMSWFAITSIQSDLEGLTQRAGPLQTKTFELQERTERLMGGLLRLSLVRAADDAARTPAAADADLQAIDKLRGEIRQLDAKTASGAIDFKAARAEIAGAVDKRLADEASYQKESAAAAAALTRAEQAVAVTRKAAQQIGVEAAKAADQAQDASRRLAGTIRAALAAQGRLKELQLVIGEADMVSNRFRLTPLKDKFKSPVDAIVRQESGATGADDPLAELRKVAASLLDLATRDGTGLLALRAAVLSKTPDAEAAYARQRKAMLDPIEQQTARLNALLDSTEVAAAKQRQALEAALRLRNEPGGVVGTSEEASAHIREMVGNLRLLMLAGNEADLKSAGGTLR